MSLNPDVNTVCISAELCTILQVVAVNNSFFFSDHVKLNLS
jgi:hypothetical protein